jgi:hypothetical protein
MKLNPKPMDTRTWDYIMKNEEAEQIEEGNPANKAKKKEAIRQLGLKAMKAGKVDPARGYIPQRAGREQLKKEETKMNEVTKKEAEETLGGPVKTKPKMPPGKQPEGYRYVRALARRAMKAGLKKEEVEQVDKKGYYVMGRTQSVAWHKNKQDAEKEAARLNMRGGTTHTVKSAARTDGLKKEEVEQVDEVNRNKTKTDDHGGRYLDSINRDKEIKELERKISKMSPNDGGGRYLAGLKLDKMKAMKEEVEQVDEVNARNSFVATQQALTPRAKDVKASVGTTRRDAAVTNKYARRISKLSGGDYSKQDVKGNLKSLAKEEAEGKVAVTPKEKSLAAHHGDKTKITFGDVLKARLKSAAAKKMGK